jgi:hypothetical protein
MRSVPARRGRPWGSDALLLRLLQTDYRWATGNLTSDWNVGVNDTSAVDGTNIPTLGLARRGGPW